MVWFVADGSVVAELSGVDAEAESAVAAVAAAAVVAEAIEGSADSCGVADCDVCCGVVAIGAGCDANCQKASRLVAASDVWVSALSLGVASGAMTAVVFLLSCAVRCGAPGAITTVVAGNAVQIVEAADAVAPNALSGVAVD